MNWCGGIPSPPQPHPAPETWPSPPPPVSARLLLAPPSPSAAQVRARGAGRRVPPPLALRVQQKGETKGGRASRCRRAGGGARKHMCGTKMAAGRARGARKRAHAASGRPRERSTADQFAAAHSALRSISWHHRAPRGANCAGYATYTPGFPKGRLQGVDPSAPVALRGTMPPDIATPSIKKLKAPFPFPPPSPIITLLLHKKIYPPLICFRALER